MHVKYQRVSAISSVNKRSSLLKNVGQFLSVATRSDWLRSSRARPGGFTVFTHKHHVRDKRRDCACGFHEPIGQPPAQYVVPSAKSLECTNAEDHPRFRDLDIFGPTGIFGYEPDFARGKIFGIPNRQITTMRS